MKIKMRGIIASLYSNGSSLNVLNWRIELGDPHFKRRTGTINDAAHTSHADQLVKTFRVVFGRVDDFVQRITDNANVDRPVQRNRELDQPTFYKGRS